MAIVTSLSGNEIFCLSLKHLEAGQVVFGNSVISRGFFGSLASAGNNMLGGEVPQITQAISEGRMNAFHRMTQEAIHHGASGVAGITSELRHLHEHPEFIFAGSCVHSPDKSLPFFTSAGDAQELYCHMDAGYRPIQHAFGNIAYSMGVGGGFSGWARSLNPGEVPEYSNIFNHTRHVALDRLVDQARQSGANAVVGIRTIVRDELGAHEMLMTGTAAKHDKLPASAIVTSDLTGEELWGMSSLGYAPLKLLMSTSIYSLGVSGGFKAFMQSFQKGEINALTKVMHDARDVAVDRIKREADNLGASNVKVVGAKTYIAELTDRLVEFMTIGTAMTKVEGAGVSTPTLPAQAIIQDEDTWVGGYRGFRLDRT